MKKLLIIVIIGAAAYFGWIGIQKFLGEAANTAGSRREAVNPAEKELQR